MEGVAIGAVLGGKYRLIREIGRGGMGVVFEAEQLDLRRRVAVKVLLATDEKSLGRLRREARAVAALASPHVVALLDFQVNDGEPPFLVMELLEGDSLAHVLKRETKLAPARAVAIASQMLSALEAAHDAGFIHRDVKPSNVWLSPGDRVKLLDFGIVKGDAGDGVRTTTGYVVGTTPYLAPELLRGGEADARSDVHAVGVVLFEMLAGRSPWDRTNPVVDILSRDPPLDALGPEVPAHAVSTVRRALAKTPSARPQTAREMREALAAPKSPLTETAPMGRVPREERSRPPTKKSGPARPVVFVASSLSVVVVGVVAFAVAVGGRARPPPVEAAFAPQPLDAGDTAAEMSDIRDAADVSAEEDAGSAPVVATKRAPARCVCHEVRANGQLTRFVLCMKARPKRCTCETFGDPEEGPCPGGPEPCFEGAVSLPFSQLESTGTCFRVEKRPRVTHARGNVNCSVCYGDIEQAATHGAPCEGVAWDGTHQDGVWWCKGQPPPRPAF